MADEKEPREERRKSVYSHERSKKARGEESERDGKKSEGKAAAEPRREDNKHLDANEMLGRHAEEREALRKAHEAERRDEHTRQRDEHRAMNARHEEEHDGVTEHPALVALHRKHEHEKQALRSEHEKRVKDMGERHHHERHTLHVKHEAEMLGAAGAGEKEAA